jgi:hypothetical protein
VFTGLAGQVVVLPDNAIRAAGVYRPYTFYNKTPVSDLKVITALGEPVATIRPGRELTLTPTADIPVAASQWTSSTPTARNPTHRVGFPYVSTVRLASNTGAATLVTGWGVFGV